MADILEEAAKRLDNLAERTSHYFATQTFTDSEWARIGSDMSDAITVVIPTVPSRAEYLERALRSVKTQTLQPARVVVQVDTDREGAGVTRQRGLEKVLTPLVAFLDDDDEFLPQHLERCLAHLQAKGADLVYPWFHVVGGGDPFPPHFFTDEWDPEQPRHTTVTTLARVDPLLEVGGFMIPDPTVQEQYVFGEEFRMVCALNDAGYKISHLPERTWNWHHHGRNSSGLPWRIEW